MDHDKDIFQQFQDEQSAWDETPPASAWERLEARLDAEPPAHAGRPWKPFVLPVIGLLLLCTLGWYFFLRPDVAQTKRHTESFRPLYEENQPEQQQRSNPAPNEDEANPAPQEMIAVEDSAIAPELDNPLTTIEIENLPVSDLTENGPQRNPEEVGNDLADLGNSALEPRSYQRAADPNMSLSDMLPASNVATYNYDNTLLNPGNMVITNGFGNVLDTVRSISQYVDGLGNSAVVVPEYLQMNATRNDISFAPRGGYRNHINPSKLEHFNWLLGSWRHKGPSAGAYSFEEWERKDAFTFEGRGFLVVNGDTVITERMRIEQRGENVYYIAALDTNQTPMRFRLRSNKPDEAVFRNPGKGFPNEVIYRQSDDGTLETNFNNGKSNPKRREEVVRNLSRK